MLSDKALRGYAAYTKREIAYARYKVGGTYYETSADRYEFPDDAPGTLNVWLVFNPPGGIKATITEVQLFDTGGTLFLSEAESITVDAAQEGVLYMVTFKFKEVEM